MHDLVWYHLIIEERKEPQMTTAELQNIAAGKISEYTTDQTIIKDVTPYYANVMHLDKDGSIMRGMVNCWIQGEQAAYKK